MWQMKTKLGIRQRIRNFMHKEGTYGELPLSARDVLIEKREEIEKVRNSIRGKVKTTNQSQTRG